MQRVIAGQVVEVSAAGYCWSRGSGLLLVSGNINGCYGVL